MTKKQLGQIFREITDPFAKNLVEESERPQVSGIDSDYFLKQVGHGKDI